MNIISKHIIQTALKTIWIAIIFLLLDQYTKYLANSYLVFAEPYPLMPNLNFTLVYNKGAAFSFLADMGGWQKWFFATLSIVISAGLIYWLKKLPAKLTTEVVAINLILSGAIGNLIDRLMYGQVTDFIDFYIGSWHYATFNVADVAIVVGAGLLIYHEIFLKEKQAAEKTEKA
jgi:signal peptidase II